MPHFLILGATGPSGIRTVELALIHGLTMTLYVRSPDKLPGNISAHTLVTVIQGELGDEEKLSSCFTGASRIDGVISTLGPKVGQPSGNPITSGYTLLLKKMREFQVKNLVLLSTVSVSAPEDKFSVVREGLVRGIKVIGYSAWSDVVATAELVRSDAAKGLEITLARVPTLTNGEAGSLHVGFIGDGVQGWTLTRRDLAVFFVREAENPKFSGKAPILSSSISSARC